MADWSILDGQFATGLNTTNDRGDGCGVYLDAPGTANTKSSWDELIASTDYDYNGFVFICGRNYTTIVLSWLIDIAIGGSGSEEIIVENLILNSGGGSGNALFIPLKIPAGTRIAVRCQIASGTLYALFCSILGVSGGFLSLPATSKIITLGADTSDSGGTGIDPGGVADTKGSYTEIESSTPYPIRSIAIAFGGKGTSRDTVGWLFDIAVGSEGNEEIIVSDILVLSSLNEVISPTYLPFIQISIPAGSRISVRCESTTTHGTYRLLDVILYGGL